ncbi:hypothetical protein CONPUDRAFT_169030 [Coniophora puteana RWD-64-598 SS2]|uniref:Uncharacterized protein n=1 Tax=Coniophora puteana (strain RWD-64-598) TaxID=741705 RepID=A0A5M3MCZ5_CONPW|nr:uncharacterized protein CONPUDRAFT_169030 [Coniophora puteana RWD-64-598 SS2]EIW76511.1 hypothetical protein CONPUDRAFT_169030 [Coniophora puteana RWD-64-598 SS2]
MDTQEPTQPTTNEARGSLYQSIRPYAQSKGPAFALATLFGASAIIPHTALNAGAAYIPPFLQRFGFSAVFGVAGYVLGSGDVRNGSGIATAWSLTYLFLNLRKSVKAPRHPLSLGLAGAAAASAGLYGTEYFLWQE